MARGILALSVESVMYCVPQKGDNEYIIVKSKENLMLFFLSSIIK